MITIKNSKIMIILVLFAVIYNQAMSTSTDKTLVDDFALHEAVKDQDENRIREVLETEKGRGQLNQLQDEKFGINKFAPLHLAVKTCNPDIVQLLLDQPGIDLAVGDGFEQATPLHYVRACSNFKEIVPLLLDADADIAAKSKYGETPLDGAHYFGCRSLVAYLIERGAAKAGGVELHEAVKAQDLPHIKEILKTESGKIQLNKLQKETGLDEFAPLHLAVKTKNQQVVRELLCHPEVDVNVRTKEQATPLHLVASAEIATLLLDAGADIEAQDYLGRTPLDRATSFYDNWNLARYLVQRGASIGHRTYKNLNPDTYNLSSQEACEMYEAYEMDRRFFKELCQIKRDLDKECKK